MSDKKQQLQDVATESVQRTGFHNLSFRTLADEVGIKSSSVHYHFKEKSSLATALIANYGETFAELLTDIDDRDVSPRVKVEAFIDIFEEVVDSGKFCLCGMMAAEVESLDAQNRAALADYFKSAEDWLAKIIGQSTCSIKPRVFARVVLSGLEGAILIDRVDGRRDCIRAQREMVRQLIN